MSRGTNTTRNRASFRSICLLRLHFQVIFLGRGESGRVADVARDASGIIVFCRADGGPAAPKALLRLVCKDGGGTEVEKATMPRQTPRTMAQWAMTCDWSLLRLVGFCLAEAYSGMPLVEIPVGVQDESHISLVSLRCSIAGSS